MVVLYAWLLADLLSGLAHWIEDRLLSENSRFKFIGGIVADNKLHHIQPWGLLRNTYWQNINTTVPITIPLTLVLFFIGAPVVLWLAALMLSVAPIIHRLAHTPKKKLNPAIKMLQFIGIFQSLPHHFEHHYDEKGLVLRERTKKRYCVMTNWLNPMLDKIGVFR